MLHIIKLIFVKEMKETLRDKRSLLTLVLVSIFMPLMMAGGFYFSTKISDGDVDVAEYSVVGMQNAPNLISYLNAQGLKTTEEEKQDNVRLLIPDDFSDKIARGYLPTLTIQGSFPDDREAVRELENLIKDYGQQVGVSRLMARGVSPIILKPFTVNVEDTGDVSLLAFIAPALVLTFLLVPIAALMPAAIDSTAGERERNALLPLLLQPIPAIAIPLGKLSMLIASGMTSLAIATSVGFLAYANIEIRGLSLGFDFSITNWLLFNLILLPTVMLLSALIMSIASFAKSFKEGQSYVALAPFVPLMFMGGGFVLGEVWRPHIPFWSETLVLSGLLSGEVVSLLPWLVTVVGYLGLVSISMWWMTRSMRRQALQG